MKVGVLALQGDVPEHLAALGAVLRGDDIVPVRIPEDLAEVAALFMPGGESTTIARLLVQGGLWNPLADRLKAGMPALATCAGLILLSHELVPSLAGMDPPTFDLLNVQVRRNDYGSQGESFEAPIRVEGLVGDRSRGSSFGHPASTPSGRASARSPGTGARWSVSVRDRFGASASTPSSRATPASTGCSSRRPTNP